MGDSIARNFNFCNSAGAFWHTTQVRSRLLCAFPLACGHPLRAGDHRDSTRFCAGRGHATWRDAAGSVLGFDPTGASGKNVGREIDLTYRFTWTETILLEAGWSELSPGRFARLTRGSDVSRWAYLMLTFGF